MTHNKTEQNDEIWYKMMECEIKDTHKMNKMKQMIKYEYSIESNTEPNNLTFNKS